MVKSISYTVMICKWGIRFYESMFALTPRLKPRGLRANDGHVISSVASRAWLGVGPLMVSCLVPSVVPRVGGRLPSGGGRVVGLW